MAIRDSIIGISDRFILSTDKTSVCTFALVDMKPSYLPLVIGLRVGGCLPIECIPEKSIYSANF